MEPVLGKGMGFLFFALATNALRLALHALRLRLNPMFTRRSLLTSVALA